MTPDERTAHERNLIYALVALAGREQSYRGNAEFKHSVDILARLLPFMVDGIGTQADAEHQDRQAHYKRLLMSSFSKLKGS